MSKYADTSELRFGSVQNLYLELETRPLTEPFRIHEPSECKMIASLCKKPLDVWSLGMLGTCIDAPAAIRFGNSSFKSFVFEVGFEKSD